VYLPQRFRSFRKWAPSTRRAVIVGGGLIGIELAEMLRSRDIATFLVRENSLGGVLPSAKAK
jgi:NADPH-dependent 2,4-dienoyl-CoA reductase/sulfur reductase-like enzyme